MPKVILFILWNLPASTHHAAVMECGEVEIPTLVRRTLQFTKPLHVLQKAVKFKVLSSDLKTMGYNLSKVQHHHLSHLTATIVSCKVSEWAIDNFPMWSLSPSYLSSWSLWGVQPQPFI